MNEKNWYSSHIKPRWNKPEKRWVSWKVQDAFNGGLPDLDNCFEGTEAKVELKYREGWPVHVRTPVSFSTMDKVTKARSIVSGAQFNHLQTWHNAGGNAFVLVGVGREFFLLRQGDYENRALTQHELYDQSVMQYTGPDCVYAGLAAIPPFIMKVYGKRRINT